MNIHNLPHPMDVVTFNPGIHHYYLPKSIKSCFAVVINGGGGGGGGFSRSSGSGGGGAGGLGGGTTSFIIPLPLVPKGIRLSVAKGGAGGEPGQPGFNGEFCSVRSIDGLFLSAYIFTGASGGGAGTVSAGGSPSGYSGVSMNFLLFQNDYSKGSVPDEPAITGNIATVLTHTYASTGTWGNRWTSNAFGGGGVTTGGTPLNGNGYTVGNGSPILPGFTASGGLASTVAVGGRGIDGVTVYDPISKILPISTGGTGGGASTFGTGGQGGVGGIGSGGGGGGSGITGGRGGNGGDGMIILVLW